MDIVFHCRLIIILLSVLSGFTFVKHIIDCYQYNKEMKELYERVVHLKELVDDALNETKKGDDE